VGGWSAGNAINAIFIHGRYAYLATPNTQELTILDIGDPTHPVAVGGFNAPGAGHGKSLYMVGDKLYLGRTITSGNPEFYLLNASVPTTILTELGSAQEVNESVNGLVIRDFLAFALTRTRLEFLRIDDPATVITYTTALSLPASGSVVEPSMDCEGNYLFVGSNNTSDKGTLSIITSTP
jgi:uncharacterized secreted protein with C-terminal beta-propeller domain